jgi:hypothetical protein
MQRTMDSADDGFGLVACSIERKKTLPASNMLDAAPSAVPTHQVQK